MKLAKAFTLIELAIAVAVLAVIFSIAIPAIKDSLVRSEIAAANAKAQEMNKALYAARMAGLTPPGNQTVDQLHAWLVANEYLRPE